MIDVSDYNVFVCFFQAEDGIRDYKVTGVQTCALPIYGNRSGSGGRSSFKLRGQRNECGGPRPHHRGRAWDRDREPGKKYLRDCAGRGFRIYVEWTSEPLEDRQRDRQPGVTEHRRNRRSHGHGGFQWRRSHSAGEGRNRAEQAFELYRGRAVLCDGCDARSKPVWLHGDKYLDAPRRRWRWWWGGQLYFWPHWASHRAVWRLQPQPDRQRHSEHYGRHYL